MFQVCEGSISKLGRTEILLEQQTSWFIGGSIWSLVGQSMVGMNQMYIFECDSWFKAGPSWSLVATVGL